MPELYVVFILFVSGVFHLAKLYYNFNVITLLWLIRSTPFCSSTYCFENRGLWHTLLPSRNYLVRWCYILGYYVVSILCVLDINMPTILFASCKLRNKENWMSFYYEPKLFNVYTSVFFIFINILTYFTVNGVAIYTSYLLSL